jgi:hypothetical protein
MRRVGLTRSVVRCERGTVTVLVAILLPVIILIGSLAIDVGDWFQQASHLQMQADAGALAGAQEFTTTACADTPIIDRARQYSGLPGGDTPVFNQIDGNSTAITEAINSQSYPPQGNPPPPDATPMTGSPCHDGFLDVKLTEGGSNVGLPWYFPIARTVGLNLGINAHARVSILQEAGGSGFSPMGLADPAPTAATAYFIDESNPPPKGAPLARLPLTNVGTNAQGQTIWSSNGATVPVAITAPNVGVIIALSGSPNNTACGQSYVNCFDLSPGPSLVHIQGYSLAGTGTLKAPLARQALLGEVPGGCTDANFAPDPGTASCSFQIQAGLDIGSYPGTPPAGVTVAAVVAGTSYPLTYSSTSAGTETWTGTASLPTGSGSDQIDLRVNCDKNVSGSVCAGQSTSATLTDVQRAYAQGSSSGPIQSAYIVDQSGQPATDSWEVCEAQDANSCTHDLGVTITVAAGLTNTTTLNAPMYTLNYGSGTSASQTGSVTCPPASTGQFVSTMQQGCQGTYICNGSVSAVKSCVTDPSCANTNPLTGGSPPPPADCIQTNPGVSQGQIVQGLTDRITTPTNGTTYYCANNWPTSGAFVLPPANDSRYITMFITPYGSFGGSGQAYFPIEGFAEFYVMGWSQDPCTSDPPPPDGGRGHGQVWGYFVQPVLQNPTAIGGAPCTASTFGPCVAVLTR